MASARKPNDWFKLKTSVNFSCFEVQGVSPSDIWKYWSAVRSNMKPFHADSALDLRTPDVLEKKPVFAVFTFIEVMVLDKTFQFFFLSNKVINMSLILFCVAKKDSVRLFRMPNVKIIDSDVVTY